MEKSKPIQLKYKIYVSGLHISKIIIGHHYRLKHSAEIDDNLILKLVLSLDGRFFSPDSTTSGVDYYAADIQLLVAEKLKTFRLVWLNEGEQLEIIGVVNAYRVNKLKKY
jgi:hypothetical protein